MRAALLIAVVVVAACSSDPCSGRSGTCITLTVEGTLRGLDQLAVTVDKPTSQTQTTTPGTAIALPMQLGLNLPATVSGVVRLDVAGLARGMTIAVGSGMATVSDNRGTATVTLGPSGARASDMASPGDLAAGGNGNSDGGDGGSSDGGDGGDGGNLPSVPSAPENVVASSGNMQATVSWSAPASSGASAITSYTVTSSPDNLKLTTSDGATTMVTFTGLTNGKSYVFDVVATNAKGSGAAASSNHVTPTAAPMVPTAPSNVVGTPDLDHGAHVSWTASDNRGSPIAHYTVTVMPGGATIATSDGGTTSVKVTGLTVGFQYYFTVTATNGIGTSDATTTIPITIAGFPGAPTGVSASPSGNNSATISWTAPSSDGFSAISSYAVTVSPGGTTLKTSDGKTTMLTVPGLTQSVSYTFTVTANNLIGASVASVPSSSLVLPLHDMLVLFVQAAGNGYLDFYDNFNAISNGTNTPSRSAVLGYQPGSFPGGIAVDGTAGIVYITDGNGHVFGFKGAGALTGTIPTPDITMNVAGNPPIAVDTVHKKLYVTVGSNQSATPLKLLRYAYATPTDLSNAAVEATLVMSTGTAYQLFVNPANGDVWAASTVGGAPGNVCQLAAAHTLSDGSGCNKRFTFTSSSSIRSYYGVVYVPSNGGTIYVTDDEQRGIVYLENVLQTASGEYTPTGSLFGVNGGALALDGTQLLTVVGGSVEAWPLSAISGAGVNRVGTSHGNPFGMVYVP
jgi:hypothetical protein